MFKRIVGLTAILISASAFGGELSDAVKKDYDEYLADLFDHFHRNPELSTVEHETARRMALELNLAGFDVAEGVGGTGIVATLKNGDGPLVMMRADMDGLPVEEKSGLENASRAQQKSPISFRRDTVHGIDGYTTYVHVPGSGFIVAATTPYVQFQETPDQLKKLFLIISLVIALLCFLLSTFIAKWISRPLLTLTAVASRLAKGEWNHQIDR